MNVIRKKKENVSLSLKFFNTNTNFPKNTSKHIQNTIEYTNHLDPRHTHIHYTTHCTIQFFYTAFCKLDFPKNCILQIHLSIQSTPDLDTDTIDPCSIHFELKLLSLTQFPSARL